MTKYWNKFLCWYHGHKWGFNFSVLPNKGICHRCHKKIRMDLKTLEWDYVKDFPEGNRTDEELIRDWKY